MVKSPLGWYLVQTVTELPAFCKSVVPPFALTRNPRRMEVYAATKSWRLLTSTQGDIRGKQIIFDIVLKTLESRKDITV